VSFIPDEIIETVRLRSDIAGVVSRYVQLKKKGKYLTGSCPFHNDRAPSFTVTPDKQIFHCFGCNAGGDVFKFLMLKENLTFNEALSMLAREAGITLPSAADPVQLERERRQEALRKINSLAVDFFRSALLQSPAAAAARRYLAGRGLSPEITERFQIGYALPEWDALLEFLVKKGCKPRAVAEAGLVVEREGGTGYYDRFRNRIMFPIWDATGRVVGFGGRVTDESLPKYVNTPETPFFVKGRNLYGLHLARPAIREKGHVVVMEGYMDVVTAHQHGVTNAVASLGTALTAEQGRLLMNYSRNIVIAYDADAAGEAAAVRGLDILQDLGCRVRVVNIPDGKDPDDFLRKYGYGSWEKLVDKALSVVEFKLKRATAGRPARTVAEKLEVLEKVFPSIAALQSEVGREEGLKDTARVLNLSWDTVAGEFRRFKAKSGKKWLNSDKIAKTRHNILSRGEKPDARKKAEAGILRLVLEDPSLARFVREETGEEPFKYAVHRKIFTYCMQFAGRPDYRPAEIFRHLSGDEQTVLSMILTQDVPGEDPAQILKDLLESIGRFDRQERREALISKINEAERAGDQKLYGELLREYVILRGIAEAEKLNDRERCLSLLNEYRQLQGSDDRRYPKEGSDII